MADVKSVEFAGVGTIPQLVVEQNGNYKHIPIKVGVTVIKDIELEEE
tara:strand:- start:7 stop:147 length:141 start_codon:yes stop_codon:yes gene_type:complete